MRVLVLGGTGWVGHWISRMLAEAGHEVTAGCRGTQERYPLPPGIRTAHLDKNDAESFRRALAAETFDAVVDSVPSPASVRNAHDLLGGRIRQYVHCSSTGVYVPLTRLPADEEHPWREPTGANFMGKVAVDSLVLQFHREDGFPATIIRPTNITGAGLIPLDIWGARHAGYWQRLRDSLPVTIPGDGNTLLQPCHVKDVARAFACALGRECAVGRTYIASSAYSITLRRYVELSKEALKSASPIEFAPPDELLRRHKERGNINEGGLRFLCLHMSFDISRARSELGYEPEFTPERGTEDAIQWMRRTGVI